MVPADVTGSDSARRSLRSRLAQLTTVSATFAPNCRTPLVLEGVARQVRPLHDRPSDALQTTSTSNLGGLAGRAHDDRIGPSRIKVCRDHESPGRTSSLSSMARAPRAGSADSRRLMTTVSVLRVVGHLHVRLPPRYLRMHQGMSWTRYLASRATSIRSSSPTHPGGSCDPGVLSRPTCLGLQDRNLPRNVQINLNAQARSKVRQAPGTTRRPAWAEPGKISSE